MINWNMAMSDELAAQIFSSVGQVSALGCAILLALLSAAAWFDVRLHRIPNKLVFGGALLALLLHLVLPQGAGFVSTMPGGLGLLDALAGLGIGLGVFFPLYCLHVMGAGDVKLMAMVGAYLGSEQIWGALFGVALAGGLLAIVIALRRGVFLRMLRNIQSGCYGSLSESMMGGLPTIEFGTQSAAKLPYGVAIALGTLGYLAWQASSVGIIHLGGQP